MNILDELGWRGLIKQQTFKLAPKKVLQTNVGGETLEAFVSGVRSLDVDIPHVLDEEKIFTLYCGFDPTAESLHVGNLVPLLALRRFQLAGHHPIAVAGGATGSIGDPSGKTAERQLLTKEILDHNIASVKVQLAKLLDFETKQNPARLVDNASWTVSVSYLEFLRDIGKHFTVNQMVAKESVRARMEDREVGISYTEFSYMLLQAYDFYWLASQKDERGNPYNCELQIGGSDQWGNITAGIELTRKKLGKQVYGLTLPLITNADGSKFGKSVAGAIWLDPKRTSVYRFYQFWINTDDRDVVRYLKFFTFLSREEITELEAKHTANPGAREAHKALAKAATDLIHGESATQEAMRASDRLFRDNFDDISKNAFEEVACEVPSRVIDRAKLDGSGTALVELLVHAGLASSKGQARKDIEGGGIYLNNNRELNTMRAVSHKDLLFGEYVLLRKGKKTHVLLMIK